MIWDGWGEYGRATVLVFNTVYLKVVLKWLESWLIILEGLRLIEILHYDDMKTVRLYNDIIMTSQITSVSIACSTVGSGADQRNIKAPRHWPLWGEFTGHRCIPRAKGQWRGKCFYLMTSSCDAPCILLLIHYVHWTESVPRNYFITFWRQSITQDKMNAVGLKICRRR